jgi:hypothetical protein
MKKTLTFFFAVLRLELRAHTLSHSTSPFFVMSFFEIGPRKLFDQAGFRDPPDLCLLRARITGVNYQHLTPSS